MSDEERGAEAPEIIEEAPAVASEQRWRDAEVRYAAATTARQAADARVSELERVVHEAEAVYQRARSDAAWSKLERARAAAERARADAALERTAAERALAEVERGRAAYEAEQRAREAATRAGRLAVLAERLTLDAVVQRSAPAIARYVAAMREAIEATLALAGLAHERAREADEARTLAAQLRTQEPPRLRTNLEPYLAARALFERLSPELRGVGVGGAVPPARHSAWEEAESAAEAAAVHALAGEAR